jgi:hypothetical protein
MNDEQSFDDLVKQKLEKEEEPVSPFLWKAIEGELPKETTRCIFVKRNALYLLLCVLTGSFFYITHDVKKADSREEIKTTAQQTIDVNTGSKVYQNKNGSSSFITHEPASEKNNLSPEFSLPHASTINPSTVLKVNRFTNGKYNINNFTNTVEVTHNLQQFYNEHSVVNDESPISYAPYVPVWIPEQEVVNDVVMPEKGVSNLNRIWPAKEKHFFTEVFYSLDFANHSLRLNNSDLSYLNLRRNTEQKLSANSFGIHGGYHLTKKFAVKTGVEWTIIKEQLNYSFMPSASQLPAGTKTNTVQGIYVDPLSMQTSGDTILDSYAALGQVFVQNNYLFCNVPLLVNYTAGKGKIKLMAGGGIFVNASFKQKGSILATDGESRIELSMQSEKNPYRSHVGIGMSAEVFLSLQVYANVELLVGPRANYYFSDLNKKQAPLTERLNNAGMFAGLKISF